MSEESVEIVGCCGVEDWLEAGEEWRVQVEDVTEAEDGRVFATLRVSIRGRGSRLPIDQRIFTVLTVSDCLISAIADHTERGDPRGSGAGAVVALDEKRDAVTFSAGMCLRVDG